MYNFILNHIVKPEYKFIDKFNLTYKTKNNIKWKVTPTTTTQNILLWLLLWNVHIQWSIYSTTAHSHHIMYDFKLSSMSLSLLSAYKLQLCVYKRVLCWIWFFFKVVLVTSNLIDVCCNENINNIFFLYMLVYTPMYF